jgi:hypothetical protein
MTKSKAPVSLADRVAASRARAIEGGARKMTVMLPEDAVARLKLLIDRGYAGNQTQALISAIMAVPVPKR